MGSGAYAALLTLWNSSAKLAAWGVGVGVAYVATLAAAVEASTPVSGVASQVAQLTPSVETSLAGLVAAIVAFVARQYWMTTGERTAYQAKANPQVLDALTANLDKLNEIGTDVADVKADVAMARTKIGEVEISVAAITKRQLILMDESNVMLWLSDNSGRCVFASRALLQLVGVGFDSFSGNNWLSLYFPEDRAEVRRQWEESVKDGVPFLWEGRYKHADGHSIAVRVTATVNPDNTLIGVVHVKRPADQLNEVIERLGKIENNCALHAVVAGRP